MYQINPLKSRVAASLAAIVLLFSFVFGSLPAAAENKVDVSGFVNQTGSGESAQSNTDCRLDKVATVNEVQGAGLQRMVIGSDQGTQHVGYYIPGVKEVSYIVGPQKTPTIWWGFGSIWEGQCGQDQFDYVADARAHAQRWLDSGHSGVVVDLRNGTIYNDGPLSDSEVQALLAVHARAIMGDMDMDGDGSGDGTNEETTCSNISGGAYGGISGCLPDTGGSTANGDSDEEQLGGAMSGTGNGGGNTPNCEATPLDHPPVNGEVWTLEADGPVVIPEFWTNWAGYDQGAHVVYLEAGTYQLNGGGKASLYPAGCEDVAQEEAGNDYWTIDDLQNANPPLAS